MLLSPSWNVCRSCTVTNRPYVFHVQKNNADSWTLTTFKYPTNYAKKPLEVNHLTSITEIISKISEFTEIHDSDMDKILFLGL